MASFKNVAQTLASAVATAGTFTVTYPTGTDAAWFISAPTHSIEALGKTWTSPTDFRISTFGADTATVTWLAATTLPAGTSIRVQLNIPGPETYRKRAPIVQDDLRPMFPYRVILGTPITADANGVCESQAGTAATAMTINGALASGGVATFDVPRNVVGAWTNTATLTVTGTDDYGNTVVETSASGTSMAGKKAFKTVTSVVPSANITGATVGTGDVLGLPVRTATTSDVIGELEDGAAATAGTVVAALAANTVSTATTADVRGTYDPNSACNGTKAFELYVLLSDPEDLGNPQYAG